jgi:hypothetical protein
MLKRSAAQISLSVIFIITFIPALVKAQTEMDAIMMNKNQACTGLVYDYSSWDHYWEGSLKRTNENLGTVSTQALMLMSNYGITNNLNIMAGVPYIKTKASDGTLQGMKGLQDISLTLKWKAFTRSYNKSKVSFFLLGGLSTPSSNYVIDFLPLSIGLGSTNLTARGMVDYQWKKFTITGSASYIRRNNVKLDRDNYYDTQLHLTNQVKMPDATQYQLRTGYRGKYILAEALVTNWTTLGGFDITRNNMPFPSNRMNATAAGASIKYTVKSFTNLAFISGVSQIISGRNVGQSTAYNFGVFYACYLSKKAKK